MFDSVDDAQAQIDAWVEHYNHVRPHQGIGMVPPVRRFELAHSEPSLVELEAAAPDTTTVTPTATRRVGANGQISFATVRYMAGKWLAGETVEIVCEDRVVELFHRGVLVATHAQRHDPGKQAAAITRGNKRPVIRTATPRPSASAASVTRKVDGSGSVSFAGTSYRAGNKYKRRSVQVAVVNGTIEISIGEELLKVHPIRHDRTREHGALANPTGRPHRINAAS